MAARVPVLVVALLLVVPAGAVAKGVQDAEACGVDRCVRDIVDHTTYLVFEPAPETRAPRFGAPSLTLRFAMMPFDGPRIHELVPVKLTFVPSLLLLRDEEGVWHRPDREAAIALRSRLAGVRPFPAARLGLPVRRARARRPERASAGPGVLPIAGGVLLAGGAVLALRRRRAAG